MGVTLEALSGLRQKGLLAKGGSVLDFGPSNLYSADAAGLREFARSFDTTLDETAIRRIADGSSYGVGVTRNESFAGELLEQVGMTYHSIDVADGYRTTIVDLNSQPLPTHFIGVFDTVLNLGTTEHILNQTACFRAIHDATKPGGYIMHQVPALGWIDHGYFTYTARFFFDLALRNDYEIASFEWSKLDTEEDLFMPLRKFRGHFPEIARYLRSAETDNALTSIRIPSVSANIIYRKRNRGPFMAPLEPTTSVGSISEDIKHSYGPSVIPARELLNELGRRVSRRLRRLRRS